MTTDTRTMISYGLTGTAHLFDRGALTTACGVSPRYMSTTPGSFEQVDCLPCRCSRPFADTQAAALLANEWDDDAEDAPEPFACADCGTATAATYVVTGAVDDREGRTEVCLPCHEPNEPNEPNDPEESTAMIARANVTVDGLVLTMPAAAPLTRDGVTLTEDDHRDWLEASTAAAQYLVAVLTGSDAGESASVRIVFGEDTRDQTMEV